MRGISLWIWGCGIDLFGKGVQPSGYVSECVRELPVFIKAKTRFLVKHGISVDSLR